MTPRRACLAAILFAALVASGCGRNRPVGTGPAGATSPGPTSGQPGPSAGTDPAPPTGPQPALAISPLSGLAASAARVQRRAVAVMIGNSPAEQPQTGLDQAQIVYEALTEGGITRYMAVYLEGEPAELGPVRSARDYFVRWALGLDAIYAHAGVSPQAWRDIDRYGVPNLNDLEGTGNYYRRPERKPPYNLYNSMARLRAEADRLGYNKSEARAPGWRFQAGFQLGDEAQSAAVLRLPYPGGWDGYTVTWRYDPATGFYLREIDGRPHRDAVTGRQLAARNILVQKARSRPIPGDDKLRIELNAVGSGDGLLVTGGRAVPAKWSKSSATAPTVWTDAVGEQLVLAPGTTWIQVVPIETEVEVGP